MRIEIKSKVSIAITLEEHVKRRLLFALGRFGERIGSVVVRLADVNGPRGGADKQCRIELSMKREGRIYAESMEPGWFAAVDLAADRISRSVARALERKRAFRFESGMVARKEAWVS